MISVSRETIQGNHICDVQAFGIPVVFFDRVCEEVETAQVTTNDFESGYTAANHLIEKGCRQITYLSISNTLSITNKRMEGYYKALADQGLEMNENGVVFCTNNEEENYQIIKNLMNNNNHPDGLIASVKKLTIAVYHV